MFFLEKSKFVKLELINSPFYEKDKMIYSNPKKLEYLGKFWLVLKDF